LKSKISQRNGFTFQKVTLNFRHQYLLEHWP